MSSKKGSLVIATPRTLWAREGHGGCGHEKADGQNLLRRGLDLSYNSTARSQEEGYPYPPGGFGGVEPQRHGPGQRFIILLMIWTTSE